jgi:four helix bundle protein
MSGHFRVENLVVYQKLCDLHLEIAVIARSWPAEERYELGSQVRRSSNGAPANLAEKHADRHVRNRIEGVNRARGEALESIHHCYMALRKGYIDIQKFEEIRERYEECVRMLNGLERTYEQQLPPDQRDWPARSPTSPDSSDVPGEP